MESLHAISTMPLTYADDEPGRIVPFNQEAAIQVEKNILITELGSSIARLVLEKSSDIDLDAETSDTPEVIMGPLTPTIHRMVVAMNVCRWVDYDEENKPSMMALDKSDKNDDVSYIDFMRQISIELSDSAGISPARKKIIDETKDDWQKEAYKRMFSDEAVLIASSRVISDVNETSLNKSLALSAVALVAALYAPQDWDGSKPKKHKREDGEGYIFRKAHFILDKMSKSPRNNWSLVVEYMQLHGSLDDAEEAIVANNHVAAFGQLNEYERRSAALIMLSDIETIAANKKDFIAEYNNVFDFLNKEAEQEAGQPEEYAFDELDWSILPPGIFEKVMRGEMIQTGNTPEAYVDYSRIKRLGQLVLDWGNGSYLAVANLPGNSGERYYAAVLPTVIDDKAMEHAVADNPSSGNAVYAFRAEKGIGDHGFVDRTWKQALNGFKCRARELGARKMLHVSELDYNILEYLLRPSEELDKSGYKKV